MLPLLKLSKNCKPFWFSFFIGSIFGTQMLCCGLECYPLGFHGQVLKAGYL
jgi:hypothetical protein